VGLTACTHSISGQTGFLSPNIYLKGPDTLIIPLGINGTTNPAFLDGSTQPVKFSIDNVKDSTGNRATQFFEKFQTKNWIKPYDYQTDTTLALINAKLSEINVPPLSINPVNGALQYLRPSRNLMKWAGLVYHVDVKASNSKGGEILKNYATIKLTANSKPFTFTRSTVAIILLNPQGEKLFTLYDYISPTDIAKHQNIYDRNGKELIDVYKKSDTPTTGVKILIQYKDAEGKIFAAKEYNTYSAGTQSYFDYAVNRQNTSEGAMIEFPITPWPVNHTLLSYLKGGTYNYTVLDTASLHQQVYNESKYAHLQAWPDSSWGANKFYVRLRSEIEFNEPGTWVISATFPYTHIDQTF